MQRHTEQEKETSPEARYRPLADAKNNDNSDKNNTLAIFLASTFWMCHCCQPKERHSQYQPTPNDSPPEQLAMMEYSGPHDAKSVSSNAQHDDMLETHRTLTIKPTSPPDEKHHTDLLIGKNITPFLASIPPDERVLLSDEQRDDIWETHEQLIIQEENYRPKDAQERLYILNTRLRDNYFYSPSDRRKMFEELRNEAKLGSPQAQFNLGNCYRLGSAVKEDTKEAVYWYRLAAEQGLPLAQVVLGYAYISGIGVEKDAKKAVHWYRSAANQGLASAQCNLGNCYKNGTGVEKDAAQAMHWYHLAAKQGLARAQLKLGHCYRDGIGTEKNFTEAKTWYLLAAKAEIEKAEIGIETVRITIAQKYAEQLAYFTAPGKENQNWEQFLQQLHTPAERKTAKSLEINSDYLSMKWYQDAQAGNPVGQYILGCCYEEGIGVKKDAKEAARWYHLAAEQGLPEAQNNLGNYFYNKLGINKNFQLFALIMRATKIKETFSQLDLNKCHQCKGELELEKDAKHAVHWYQLAAKQGYAHGQNSLGYCYDYGIGVKQDAEQAVHWYQLAAEQGLAEAQNNLGHCYRYAMGVKADNGKAIDYYAEAATQKLAEAQANLGDCYFCLHMLGRYAQNSYIAKHLYHRAAEQGIVQAPGELAREIFFPSDSMGYLQKTYVDAKRYAHLAAEQGYPPAQVQLGLYYADGVKNSGNYVIEQNITTAMKWWREAASYDISFLTTHSGMGKHQAHIETISKEIDTVLVKSFAKETARLLPLVIQWIIGGYLTGHEDIVEATLSSWQRQPQSMSWRQQVHSFFQKNISALKSLTTTSKPDSEPTTTNTNPPSPNG